MKRENEKKCRNNAFKALITLTALAGLLAGCYVAVGHPPRGHRPVVVHPGPPGPPPVVVAARPRLVFVAEYGIYVAPDVEVSLFFHDNAWYYFHADTWYSGPNYDGPWVVVKGKRLPPGLTKVPPGQLRKMAKTKNGGGKGRKFK